MWDYEPGYGKDHLRNYLKGRILNIIRILQTDHGMSSALDWWTDEDVIGIGYKKFPHCNCVRSYKLLKDFDDHTLAVLFAREIKEKEVAETEQLRLLEKWKEERLR